VIHPLDRPIWSALATRQKHFDPAGVTARRFPANVSPLVAPRDLSAASLSAATDLIPPNDDISLVERTAPEPPPGIIASTAVCLQMTAQGIGAGQPRFDMEELGEADAPEMLALATLTKPGPFRARTHALGRFLGVRDGGRLIAMAGERLHVDGFHEISAVCTHPDYRGRGLGAGLMQEVGARMLAEGDTPFLHTYAANTGAVSLYRRLGFEARCEIIHVVWKRA
jgi:predicted GNAT family acetyltransferase